MELEGIHTPLIKVGDNVAAILMDSIKQQNLKVSNGDIFVIAESVIATAENNVYYIDQIIPSKKTQSLAQQYDMSPVTLDIVRKEADEILGYCYGMALTIKNNILMPNAGVDNSNAPLGTLVALPKNPQDSAHTIRKQLEKEFNCKLGVVIADSRVQPLRLGCVGIALAASGFIAVEDVRGQKDLFGRKLKFTRLALADNLCSAAELIMGENDAQIPAVLIHNAPVTLVDTDKPVQTIVKDECLYMGALKNKIKKN